MARPALDVWLYGHRIAVLSEPSLFRYRLEYVEEALDEYGEGARVLSLALPVTKRPITDAGPDGRVSAFIEGLLPEGNLRQQVAATAGVPTVDKIGLLTQVGAECAGAVQILPPGLDPANGNIRPLTRTDVDRLVADLPTYHVPEGAALQASLAGIQDKVLLTRLGDDGWGWPENGAVSSHLIKPEPTSGAVAHLISTEHWSLEVARRVGIAAAQAQLDTFDGRLALVVNRYDRTDQGVRIHQEDFCQALGLGPEAKYESTAEAQRLGTRLRRLAELAAPRAVDPTSFRLDLLRAITFNMAIGNGDAHSKNYSVLIDRDGAVTLAPVYDCAPVMYLDPRFGSTGQVVNGRTSISNLSVDDLVSEGRSWGIPQRLAVEAVESVFGAVKESAHAIAPPEGAEEIVENLDALWAQRSWPV